MPVGLHRDAVTDQVTIVRPTSVNAVFLAPCDAGLSRARRRAAASESEMVSAKRMSAASGSPVSSSASCT